MRRTEQGFTLIELLIVVVIIGILAAIAIPKFATTKGSSYLATMKTDIRNLATAQEAYVYDNEVYYIGAVPSGAFNFTPSQNVSVTINEATNGGWSATVSHALLPGRTCALFVGGAAPVAPASVSGTVACN